MDIIKNLLPLDLYKIIDEYSSTAIIWHKPNKNDPYILGYNTCDPDLLIYLDNVNSKCIVKRSGCIGFGNDFTRYSKNNTYKIITYGNSYVGRCNIYNCVSKHFIYLPRVTTSRLINYPDENIHMIHSDVIDYFLKYKSECYIDYISNKYKIYSQYINKTEFKYVIWYKQKKLKRNKLAIKIKLGKEWILLEPYCR